MTAFPKPRIVISKCIGFDPCRYNGEIVQDKFVTHLQPHVEFVCVCPEVEIGLGTPRAPVRVVASGSSFKLIQPSSGLDLSAKMRGFSSRFLDDLKKVDGFILKNRSPSCGFTDVKVYAGPEKGAAIGRTAGFLGGAVLEQFGDRAVEDEGRLKNLNIREHFLTRVFAFAQFRSLQQTDSIHSLTGRFIPRTIYARTRRSALKPVSIPRRHPTKISSGLVSATHLTPISPTK